MRSYISTRTRLHTNAPRQFPVFTNSVTLAVQSYVNVHLFSLWLKSPVYELVVVSALINSMIVLMPCIVIFPSSMNFVFVPLIRIAQKEKREPTSIYQSCQHAFVDHWILITDQTAIQYTIIGFISSQKWAARPSIVYSLAQRLQHHTFQEAGWE